MISVKAKHQKPTKVTVVAWALGFLVSFLLFASEYKSIILHPGRFLNTDLSLLAAAFFSVIAGGCVVIVILFLFRPREG